MPLAAAAPRVAEIASIALLTQIQNRQSDGDIVGSMADGSTRTEVLGHVAEIGSFTPWTTQTASPVAISVIHISIVILAAFINVIPDPCHMDGVGITEGTSGRENGVGCFDV